MEFRLVSKWIENEQKGIVTLPYLSLFPLVPFRRRNFHSPPSSPVPSLTIYTAQNLDLYEDTRTTWREMNSALAKDILTDKVFAPWKLAAYLAEYADRLYYTPKRAEVNPTMRFKVLVTIHYMKHKVKAANP